MQSSRFGAVLLFFFLSFNLFSQTKLSTQFQGALISPFEAERGVGGLARINYNLNSQFNLYLSTGLIYWDRNNLRYSAFNFDTVSDESDHYLYPVLFGLRFVGRNESAWIPFIEMDAGLSYLNYRKGTLYEVFDPEGEELDHLELREIRGLDELFISAGISAGLQHKISNTFGMEIGLKVNTNFNNDNPFFAGTTTYTALYWGVQFSLI